MKSRNSTTSGVMNIRIFVNAVKVNRLHRGLVALKYFKSDLKGLLSGLLTGKSV
jgi:hypothetical protein